LRKATNSKEKPASTASSDNAKGTIDSLKKKVEKLEEDNFQLKEANTQYKSGIVTQSSPSQWAADDYGKIQCPRWPSSDEEYDKMSDNEKSKLDAKLRFLYRSQNPEDCSKAKYLLFRQITATGIGAQLAPIGVMLLIAATYNRVLIRVYT
jgi:hypothetical protein